MRLTEEPRNEVLLRKVFEYFVWRLLERHLTPTGWKVEHAKSLEWQILSESPNLRRYLPGMEADIRLRSPDGARVIIVDTKFKNVITTNKWGMQRFTSANLYQIFSYVLSQRHRADAPNEAVLLYPVVGQLLSEFAEMPGITLRFETVDLRKSWREVEADLVHLFQTGTLPLAMTAVGDLSPA